MLDEIWKLLDDDYKVYTESKRTRNKILKLIGQSEFTGTVYSKNGKDFAWDILFNKEYLQRIKALIKHD
jgi:hypothetical protein